MLRSPLRYAVFAAVMAAVGARAQSFNIDIDVFFGEPYIGNGAPSSAFGAAAGQPGFWNRVYVQNGSTIQLAGLGGAASAVTMSKTADNPGGRGGFFFPGNTGDYALLLNDVESVATIVSGGTLTYTFSGLQAGVYDVYTYAATQFYSQTPITVNEATRLNTQTVTGPMPGNAFEYLITHSIHHVEVGASGEFHISITQPPNHPRGMSVNGLQIVAVPEPSSAFGIAFGMAIALFRWKRPRHRRD